MNLDFVKFKNPKYQNIFDKILPDLILWTIIFVLLVFTEDWSGDRLYRGIREMLFTFTPIVIIIYAHFFFFHFFFLKRKYVLYLFLSVLLFTVFYFIIQYIFIHYVPNRRDDIVFSMFFYSLMYIGFRYLIKAPRQILKMKEAEAKRAKAERDLQEMEAKHSKAELEVLKSQVNPHFLFNSLNNIYSLTMIDAKRAGESILTLSDMMRYNLESGKKKYVTLHHEVEFINNYIQLESLRVSEICKITFETDEDFKSKVIAPLMLISFVENCFKHGISSDENQNFIKISVKLQDNMLYFETENRIAPPRVETQNKDVKIGIENVKRRLELLYPEKYNLKINVENSIYKVNLIIEL